MTTLVTPHDIDLDDEAKYGSIVGTIISLVPDVDKRSTLLPEWRVAEKRVKDEIAKGADPSSTKPIELRLPKVGKLRIAHEGAQPPHRIVRVEFDNAQVAKKARALLRDDFAIETE